MVVCCGGHLLVLAALGGLAVGTVVGVLGGVLAATLLIAVVVVMCRRRPTAECDAGRRRVVADER